MSNQKIGEGFATRMAQLGLNELRNIAAFDNSKVVDDIRQTAGPQQEPTTTLDQMQNQQDEALSNQVEDMQQSQDQALEQQQER